MENELHYFLDVRGKTQNGRNNTKRAKKSYFHCGLQQRKQLKVL